MKKALNFLLILTFALTLLVPLTGVPIHKSASLLFLCSVWYMPLCAGERWTQEGVLSLD